MKFIDVLDDSEKEKLVKFLAEKDQVYPEELLKNQDDLVNIGVIEYTTPDDNGVITLYRGRVDNHSPGALVKFKNGQLGIVIDFDDCEAIGLTAAVVIAHELGHLIERHLHKKRVATPDRYKKKITAALKADDEDLYTNLVAKSIADGGCLDIELEADIVACKLVGVDAVIADNAKLAVNHKNVTVALHHMNKIKRLMELKAKTGLDLNPLWSFRYIPLEPNPE